MAQSILTTGRALGAYLRRNSLTLIMLLCASTFIQYFVTATIEPIFAAKNTAKLLHSLTGYDSFETMTHNLSQTKTTDDNAPHQFRLMVSVGCVSSIVTLSGFLVMTVGHVILLAPFEVAAYAALGAPGRLTWCDSVAVVKQATYSYVKCRVSYLVRAWLVFWFGIKALRDWWLVHLIVVHEPHMCSDAGALIMPGGTASPIFARSRQLVVRNPLIVNCVLIGMLPFIICAGILMDRAFVGAIALGLPAGGIGPGCVLEGHLTTATNASTSENVPTTWNEECTFKTKHIQAGITSGLQSTLFAVANAYLFERLLHSV